MEIVRFEGDEIELEVLPAAGARIHRVRVFGHDLLRTPADTRRHLDDPFFWGAYVMAPWSNRIAATPVQLGGRTISVGPNFPDGSAIHGQVFGRPWLRVGDAAFGIDGGGDGWPWPYAVRLALRASGSTLRLRLGLTNRADDSMPAGLGLHPWFRRPLEAAIRAAQVFERNDPSPSQPAAVSGLHDLRTLRRFPPAIDATWANPATPAVELRWPRLGIGAAMTIATPSPFIVAASPAEIDAVAIEAQTHGPNGLRRLLRGEPGGLMMLAPGSTLDLAVQLAFERLSPG